jgi:hypothetical protein
VSIAYTQTQATLNSWRDSYVHEVLSALGFYAKPNNDQLTLLFPIGSAAHEEPLSLCYVVSPDEDLDNTLMGRNWAEKTIRSLRETGLELGLADQWQTMAHLSSR